MEKLKKELTFLVNELEGYKEDLTRTGIDSREQDWLEDAIQKTENKILNTVRFYFGK